MYQKDLWFVSWLSFSSIIEVCTAFHVYFLLLQQEHIRRIKNCWDFVRKLLVKQRMLKRMHRGRIKYGLKPPVPPDFSLSGTTWQTRYIENASKERTLIYKSILLRRCMYYTLAPSERYSIPLSRSAVCLSAFSWLVDLNKGNCFFVLSNLISFLIDQRPRGEDCFLHYLSTRRKYIVQVVLSELIY